VLRLGAALCLVAGVALALALSSLAASPPGINWALVGGGAGEDDADGIGADARGRLAISGGFTGTVRFGSTTFTTFGSADIFAAGYSANGRLRWARRFGGPGPDQSFDNDVDPRGNAVLTGSFNRTVDFGGVTLTSRGGDLPRYGDAFLLKLDSLGRTRWVRQIGGPGSDGGDEIAIGPQDEAFVIGDSSGETRFTESKVLPATGGRDAWAARYRRDGSLVWAQSLGGPGEQQSHGISADPRSNALVTGEFTGTAHFGPHTLVSAGGRPDIFVAKLDKLGRFRWAQRFGDNDPEEGRGVDADSRGNVYLSGEFSGTLHLGGHVLTSAGRNDLFVAKLSRNGVVRWASSMGGTGDEEDGEIETAPDGTSYVTGSFEGSGRFGNKTLTASGIRGAFLVKVSRTGQILWAVQSTDSPFSALGELTLGPDSVNLLGRFAANATLGRFELPGIAGTDYFIAQLRR
jgi:hypothetical protein